MQYVGSAGWNQSDQRDINTLPLADLAHRQAVASGTAAKRVTVSSRDTPASPRSRAQPTNYNSLQAGLRIENKHGLTTQFSYTWSHEIDIQSGDLGSTNMSGSSGAVSDPFNLKYDRGSGVLDRRHIFSANYDYQLPFYRSGGNMLEHEVLGGWELSGVTVAEAVRPINVTYSTDTLGLGGGTVNRPNLVGSHSGPKIAAAVVQHRRLRCSLRSMGRWTRTRASAVPAKMPSSVPGSSTGTSPCSRAFHSPRTKDRTSKFASRPSTPSITPSSITSIPASPTRSSDKSPARTIRA